VSLVTLLSGLGAAPACLATDEAPATTSDSESEDSGLPFDFGFAIGYGHGIESRERQEGRDVRDVRMLALAPHLRWLLGQPGSGERWFHGDVHGIVEGQLLINFAPQTGAGGGVVGVIRYSMLRERRWRPYGEIGVGVGGLGFGLESQDDGFTFLLHGGLGLRWQPNRGPAWTASVRWHHISNAQTHLPNNGIDDIMFLVGVEF
jgi:hypothetical protein